MILTHGPRTEYQELVKRLLEDGVPAEAIHVVHNPARTERLSPVASAQGVTAIECSINRGYANGMNIGIGRCLSAGTRFVLLLTAEVRLRSGALALLLAAADRAPQYGVIGPALWWLGQNRPWSYGGTRNRWGATDQVRDHQPTVDRHGIAPCEWVDGSAMLIRSELIREVGLLDERFFLYFEETEFCLRAERAGWRVGVALEAVAEQAPGDDRRPGGYSFLLTRNSLEYSRLVAGGRGVAAAMARSARESLRMVHVAAGRRSSWPARKWAVTKLVAIWLGIIAFLARRWGRPPRFVPGLGDIR